MVTQTVFTQGSNTFLLFPISRSFVLTVTHPSSFDPSVLQCAPSHVSPLAIQRDRSYKPTLIASAVAFAAPRVCRTDWKGRP